MPAFSEIAKKPIIDALVSDAMEELAPDVRYIRYDIADDSTGKPALFFRVVLSDAAYSSERFSSAKNRVTDLIMSRLDWDLDLYPHFRFRSESDQAKIREEMWAPLPA